MKLHDHDVEYIANIAAHERFKKRIGKVGQMTG